MPEPQTLPAWLTEADLDYCTQVFMHTGFRGALNRYRNLDRDWEELSRLGELKPAEVNSEIIDFLRQEITL